MATVVVRQSSSAATHPGELSEADIDELGLRTEPPVGARMEEAAIGAIKAGTGFNRHDAGVLTIAICFVLGGIAGGSLQEAGKDIYCWVKLRLLSLMEKKRKATQSSVSAYSFKMPKWRLEISAEYRPSAGFTATAEASTPEAMDEAMRTLAEYLEVNAASWDLPSRPYYWSCYQTIGGLHITSGGHEP